MRGLGERGNVIKYFGKSHKQPNVNSKIMYDVYARMVRTTYQTFLVSTFVAFWTCMDGLILNHRCFIRDDFL